MLAIFILVIHVLSNLISVIYPVKCVKTEFAETF